MKKKMLIAAALAGALVVPAIAHAENAPPADAKEKHGCKGKAAMDKESCKGKAAKEKMSCAGKDGGSDEKMSCGGKDGCGGKDKKS